METEKQSIMTDSRSVAASGWGKEEKREKRSTKRPKETSRWWFHGHVHMLCAQSLSSVWLIVTPWTVALQAPLSMGSLQARILEWVVMPSSRGSSQPRDRTQVSYIAGGFFTIWATREAQSLAYTYVTSHQMMA